MALDSFIDDDSDSSEDEQNNSMGPDSNTEAANSIANYVKTELKAHARRNGTDIEIKDGKIIADPHDLGVAYLTIAAKRYDQEVSNILDNLDS